MAWETKIVESCPISRETWGIILMTPRVIRALAGAVLDERGKEWLVFLLGEYLDPKRLRIQVDGLFVPRDQTRSGGGCSYEGELPEDIADRKVGVLHSHHGMGVFWSPTDENDLNPYHPMSIVISSSWRRRGDSPEGAREAMHLGFDYLAIGNAELPCGSLGKIRYHIMPQGVTDWPIKHNIIQPRTDRKVESVEGCAHWAPTKDTTLYAVRKKGNCGAEEEKPYYSVAVFGRKGDTITTLLPPVDPPKPVEDKGSITQYYNKDREIRNGKQKNAVIVYRTGSDGGQPRDYADERYSDYEDEYPGGYLVR